MDGRGRTPQTVSGRTLNGQIDSLLTECDPPPRLIRLESDFRNFEPFRSDCVLAPIVHQAASSQRDGVLRLEGIKYGFFAPRLVRPPAQWEPECPAHAQASASEPHSVLRVAVALATPRLVRPCLRMRPLPCPPRRRFHYALPHLRSAQRFANAISVRDNETWFQVYHSASQHSSSQVAPHVVCYRWKLQARGLPAGTMRGVTEAVRSGRRGVSRQD